MPKIPPILGKYAIRGVLGQGSMGTVYEGRDPLIDRKVAIKCLAPDLAREADLRERFLREAQAAGALRHPNIVTVYDMGEHAGLPYIAMEFVEGTDLSRLIQEKALSLEWKIDVIRQLCEGLAYAHGKGIVHRDVKPANVRLTPQGEVRIMDFGIARLASSSLTKRGLLMGSIHYVAPEQVEGGVVDQRADVYSVGAIAYELLAGRKPFEADSLSALMAKITREDADASALPKTAYSPGLEALVIKALARNVDERYSSLDALRVDLARIVRDVALRGGILP